MTTDPRPHWNRRTRLTLAAAIAALAAMGCWLEWSALRSARHSLSAAHCRLATVRNDVARITALQSVPHRATERRLPHEALVAVIDQARNRATLDARALTSIWPEPPRRLGRSDYLTLATRLHFEKVPLDRLTRFAHALQSIDASLRLTAVRLLSQQHPGLLWDAELTVTYLIYAPHSRGPPV